MGKFMLMAHKVVIFDLDGTIADILPLLVKILNSSSAEFGYNELKEENIEELRAKDTSEALRHLGISIFKLPFLVKKARAELSKEIDKLRPIKGISEALSKVKKAGYKLGILTSNSEENVRKFLENNGLQIFDFIYSGSSFFGKGRVLKNLLLQQNLKSSEVVYVADETRDVKAARKAGVKIVAVSWGFNSRQAFTSSKPDSLVDKPEELVKVLETL